MVKNLVNTDRFKRVNPNTEQKLENDLKVNFQEIVSLRVMNLKVTNLRVEANYLIQKVPVNLRVKVVDEEDLKEATILDKEIPI